ncbi:MAG: hemin ABC transporter substrate-binding protein [Gemmatimonadetes bacterium]|nr:hemin ABC transporter substrate-binding protein [Gemmatimonadota bacterium]MXW79903.1 hemin ABC transporter substrate-binding protein [Gemmatimonadota bacterium]MYC73668.1 hemin ABC transporter substrate-binding protein [Gemmatimonadota bacterium]MYI62187.1 hemin ABC transporter substrate-binding protein [Gemmatimonadota bacterium]
MKWILCLLMTALLGTTSDAEEMPNDSSRIVTLGGTITEIVFALGAGERVVGVDASSSFPEAVNQLPKVAYHRRLSAEGVLSLRPTLIIATTEAGPPEALQQLESAGVTVLILPHDPTVENAIAKIERIAAALNVQARGTALVQALKEELSQVQSSIPQTAAQAKILFLYARGQGTLMVAGQDTSADTMIDLAGGTNAVQGYSGYKPLTSEAAVAAAPDLILLMDSGLESIGGTQGLWQLPGLALTPAGQQGRVLSMDGLFLLGFGPRLGQAALALNEALYEVPRKTESNDVD